jgi:hypothetical protein
VTNQEYPNDMQPLTIVLHTCISNETAADLRADPVTEWPAVRGLLADCEPAIHVVAVAPAFTKSAGSKNVGAADSEQSGADQALTVSHKTREQLLEALTSRIRYSTVPLSSPETSGYVALARSEHSDELHIVGAAATLRDALGILAQAEDFSPEALVDLAASSEQRCVLPLDPASGAVYRLGISELRP